MTIKERTTVQNLINKMDEFDEIENYTLKTLQDMNVKHGDGHRWCSWDACLEGIAKNNSRDSIEYKRAAIIYRQYIEASAKIDLIRDFGIELSKVGFWKK